MSAASIARLKITLDDVKPAVLRRIEVPLTLRLDRLHLAIQSAMGWTNSHLYEIRAGDVGWGMTDPDWGDGPVDARKPSLGRMFLFLVSASPWRPRSASLQTPAWDDAALCLDP
jgi:hypothetical protein